VLTEAQAASLWGSSLSRRTECGFSMHDRGSVASDGFAAIFRKAEEAEGLAAFGSRFVKPRTRARTVK